MPEIRCLVICEGSSDFAFIDGVIRQITKKRNIMVDTILIKPELDATSGRTIYERFGYKGVENWCRKQLAMLRARGRSEIGTLAAFHNADIVLVHLDADIADSLDINDTKFVGGIKDRRNWCATALDNWLGIVKSQANVKYVIPTVQIETWLLSTFDNNSNPEIFSVSITDYEQIEDVENLLLKLAYHEDTEKPGRLYKERNLFETDSKYVPRLVNDLDKASSRCSELALFVDTISAYC